MRTLILQPKGANKTGVKTAIEQTDRVHLKDQAEGISGEQRVDKGKDDKLCEMEKRQEKMMECNQRDDGLKLSIVETQPEESLSHSLHNAPRT